MDSVTADISTYISGRNFIWSRTDNQLDPVIFTFIASTILGSRFNLKYGHSGSIAGNKNWLKMASSDFMASM